jgi:ABC-2 type transport system permease protein
VTATNALAPGVPAKRVGMHNWLASYRAMLRWEIVGARLFLPLLVIVQILAGAGFVLGFGLLIPNLNDAAATYLSTGAVVMSLILIGLIVTPQIVAQQKMEGSYDFMWSLPVPRSAASLASVTLAGLVAIPGVVAALLVAVLRYDLTFAVHPSVVPAFVLTLACGALLGAALAHGLDQPQLTMLVSQLTVFFVIGFSPINFPIERLPGWLGALHEYLPIHHMALAVRSSLTDGLVEMTTRSWVILTVWAAAAGGATGIVLVRRK